MAFAALIPAAISGVSSLLGGLFGKKQTQTQTTTPNLSPLQQSLSNNILGAGQNMLSSAPTDLTGYASGAIQGNNQTGQSQMSALQRTLLSRGLINSPMATSSQAAMRLNTANQNQGVINQIPLLQRQLLQQSLGSAIDAFRSSPYGQTQTGSGTSNLPVGGAVASGLGSFGATGAGTGLFSNLFGGGGGGGNFNNVLPIQSAGPYTLPGISF